MSPPSLRAGRGRDDETPLETRYRSSSNRRGSPRRVGRGRRSASACVTRAGANAWDGSVRRRVRVCASGLFQKPTHRHDRRSHLLVFHCGGVAVRHGAVEKKFETSHYCNYFRRTRRAGSPGVSFPRASARPARPRVSPPSRSPPPPSHCPAAREPPARGSPPGPSSVHFTAARQTQHDRHETTAHCAARLPSDTPGRPIPSDTPTRNDNGQ